MEFVTSIVLTIEFSYLLWQQLMLTYLGISHAAYKIYQQPVASSTALLHCLGYPYWKLKIEKWLAGTD